jgi:tRNA G18 (ribose-2'-O)-methylase SpoU
MSIRRITSRANSWIKHLKRLGTDKKYRYERGLFLCDGEKLLAEAYQSNAVLEEILIEEGLYPRLIEEYPWLADHSAVCVDYTLCGRIRVRRHGGRRLRGSV